MKKSLLHRECFFLGRFIVSAADLESPRSAVVQQSLRSYVDTVKCVQTFLKRSSGWRKFYLKYSLKSWHVIYVSTSVILTIFDVLIAVEVNVWSSFSVMECDGFVMHSLISWHLSSCCMGVNIFSSSSGPQSKSKGSE